MGAKTGIYLLALAALAVNITTQDLLLMWAYGSLLVMPTVKILNFTRLNHSLVIVARGPGYVVYATPLANAATQRVSTSVVPIYDNHETRGLSAVCHNYDNRSDVLYRRLAGSHSTDAGGPAGHLCAGSF